MKEKKSKKGIIIIFLVFIVFGMGIGVFFLLNKPEEDTFDINMYIVSDECYKTIDQKYQFFFISKEDELFDTINNRLSKELPKDYVLKEDNIQEFVYINNYLFVITSKDDIGDYSKYTGYFAKSPREMHDEVFITYNPNKTILEKEEKINGSTDEVDEFTIVVNRFSSDENVLLPYKAECGYFFLESKTYGPEYLIVYTKEFKKIGYINRDLTTLMEDDGGIYLYDNSELKGETKRYNALGSVVEEYMETSTITIDVRGEEYTIDYSKLEDDITQKIKDNNYKIYLKKCDCSKVRDESYIDRAKCDKKELSIDSVKKVIKKLKRTENVEYKLSNNICSKYSYYIDSSDTILNVYEANDITTLLVGFDNNGFAYHFQGENVETFFKSLDE